MNYSGISQKNIFKTIFLLEISIVFFIILGIIPQEFSYVILVLLIAGFMKLSILDSLKLFILSIPFFVALPANQLSDSMSIWRILILALVLKVGWEKIKVFLFLSSRAELWSFSDKAESRDPSQSRVMFIIKLFLKSRDSSAPFIRTSFTSVGMTIKKKILKLKKYVPSFFQEKSDNNYYKLFLLTTLFFLIVTISLISAQDIGAGVKKMLFLLNIFLLFPVVIFAIKSKNDLMKIMKFIFCSSAIVILVGYAQFISTFFFPLFEFWQFWAQNVIKVFYGQNLSNLLTFSNTWFSYYDILPATLRMFSVLPDSHSFAMLAIISTPVILSLIFYSKRKNKKYLAIALMAFMLSIFFSGSRGAWVSSVFALLAAIYLFTRLQNAEFKKLCKLNLRERLLSCPCFKWLIEKLKTGKLINKIAFFKDFSCCSSNYFSKIIICSILLFFILMPVSTVILKQNQEVQLMRSNTQLSDDEREKINMFERAFSISDFSETSNKGRVQIWIETTTSIKNNLFFGIGFGNFPLLLGENISALKKGSSAHCVYLDIMAETGIFGLAVFLLLLLEILKTSYKLFFKLKTSYLKIFAGSFFVYFIWICSYGLFDVVIFNDKVLMVVVMLIGVLYSLGRIKENSLKL